MRIQILSDVHFDHGHVPPKLSSDASVDLIIVAGDISNGGYNIEKFFEYINLHTKVEVLVVLGNHDYYSKNRTFEESVSFYKSVASYFDGIHVLDREIFVKDGVRFLGTTLWTDYDDRRDEVSSIVSMPCFRSIVKDSDEGSKRVFVDSTDIIDQYLMNVGFLEKNIDNSCKNVVITHHIPTFNYVNPKFGKSSINGAFCTDLNNMIMDKNPDIWICGHTHDHFTGQIGNCRIYCNPWGYPFEKSTGYVQNFEVEI